MHEVAHTHERLVWQWRTVINVPPGLEARNSLLMGPITAPISVSSEKTAASNSPTIAPRPKLPRLPPLFLDGHELCFLAISPKSAPLAISSLMRSASSSVDTRMWLADACSALALEAKAIATAATSATTTSIFRIDHIVVV